MVVSDLYTFPALFRHAPIHGGGGYMPKSWRPVMCPTAEKNKKALQHGLRGEIEKELLTREISRYMM